MDAFSLSDTYLFRGAAIGDIDSVQSISEAHEFAGGEKIVSEGDKNQDIMVITSGRARVETRDGNLLDELRKGAILGEIAFLDGKGRTANVTALGPVTVLTVPAGRLRDLMKGNPSLEVTLLRNIAVSLCDRIRDANQQVEAFLTPR